MFSDLYAPAGTSRAPVLDGRLRTGPAVARTALLINPFYRKDPHGSFGKHVLTPTLALTSIAAATPPGWQVRYWDENLLKGPPPHTPFPQVVGITVHLTFARRAYELARWYRARGAMVVMGGLHVVSCREECAPHADVLALGDGVKTWPQILRDIERGCLKPRYEGGYDCHFAHDPTPERAVLPRRDFLTTASLIATRGCKNRCAFCYLATCGLEMPCERREAEDVAREFAATGEPYGVFTDNNLGAHRPYLRELCRALRPLEKIWSAAVTVDVTDDEPLVREMAQAGCTGVFVGFESLSAQNLSDAGKNTPHPRDYARRVALFHRYGIQVNGSFVFGFDHDGPDVFERTAEWIEENRLECATFHILTPYPGTPLFDDLQSQGRLLHKNWELYDTAHAVFRPRLMTPEQLEAGYSRCYRRLFTLSSIWKRRPLTLKATVPYVAMSLLYKRANRLWPFVIRHGLTHALWRPLVEISRRRHVAFRRHLCEPPPICHELLIAPGV